MLCLPPSRRKCHDIIFAEHVSTRAFKVCWSLAAVLQSATHRRKERGAKGEYKDAFCAYTSLLSCLFVQV